MMNRGVDFSQSGKLWILLVGGMVFLYLLWVMGHSISTGSTRFAMFVAALFVAFFVAGRMAGDWRSGVYYFLVWLLFEDLIRKYLGNNMAIYFVKDVLVLITYGSFVIRRKTEESKPFHPPFKHALILFFVLGVVQVFNAHSPSVFYGLLGLKLYFFYVPLMFVGYALLREERYLKRFFVVNMALAAVISSVGIAQSILGLDFLNPHGGEDIEYLSHLVRVTPSGVQVPRPPSVFVSDGRFGAYLLVVFVMGLGAAGYLLLRAKGGRLLVFPALGLVVLGAVVTGSRGAFAYFVITAVVLSSGMLWGAPKSWEGGYRLVKAIRRSFVFITVGMALAIVLFPDVIGARWTFYRETLSPTSQYSETGHRAWGYPVSEFLKAVSDEDWAEGHGIGTASLGVQYVSRILGARASDVGVENGYGCILLEFGILGPVLWVIWGLSLLATGIAAALKVKGTWAFPVAISVVWLIFLLMFPFTWGTLNLYENFVVNAYFWLLVGILFRLPSLVTETEASQDRASQELAAA